MAGANTTERTLTFSQREREVLDLIVRGHTNGEIAETLGISFATAKWHVSELIGKLGVSSREEVADYWRWERSPRRRFSRALSGLIAGPALKLAGGGAVAGVAATGVVLVAIAANGSGGSPIAVSVTPTPTPAPATRLSPSSFGEPAPQFTLPDIRDLSHLVQLDDFLGQPLVLTWYASSCELCRDELVQLDALHAQYPDVAVLAINQEETAVEARAFLDALDVSLDSVLDEPGDVGQRYNVNSLPTTFFIDRTGFILEVGRGPAGALIPRFLRAVGILEPNPPSTRPAICPTSGPSPEGPLCHALNWPHIAALDKGDCDLSGADLNGPTANLSHIDFRGCNLDGARLSGMLNGATLENVSAKDADFSFSTIANANFAGADLTGADLARGVLQKSDFTNANLLRADLTNTITRGATWNNTICPDGTNSDANGGTCVGTISVSDYWPGPGGWAPPVCSTGGGPLDVGKFCAAELYAGIEVDASGTCYAPLAAVATTDFRHAGLRGCQLAGLNLATADFERASLVVANLEGADLTGASIFLADLSGANLRGTILEGVVISHTSLEGADLTGASTTGALMRGTYKNTTCPDGTNSDTDDGDGLTCANNLLP